MNGKMLIVSATMQAVWKTAERAANSNCTVLLTGESGTGKELVAREMHFASPRKDGPFVAINCGALAESLLESELFGHERGSFTGANARHPGLFEQAKGGTLFLDEIGEISPALQVKLLRVLEEREVKRVGGTETVPVDVRVIAATNADIDHLMTEKLFRRDLYYRLNVVALHLPPLRERPDDIRILTDHFRKLANLEHNREVEAVSAEALQLLMEYSWPGNIRELSNIIQRMVVLSEGNEIRAADVPSEVRAKDIEILSSEPPPLILPEGGMDLVLALARHERSLVVQALDRTGGNRTQAALLLRINRTTLVEKLRRIVDGQLRVG